MPTVVFDAQELKSLNRGEVQLPIPLKDPNGINISRLTDEISDMPEVRICSHDWNGLLVAIKTGGIIHDMLNMYVNGVYRDIIPKIHQVEIEALHPKLFGRFEDPYSYIKAAGGKYDVRLGWIPDSVMSAADRRPLSIEYEGIGPIDCATPHGRGIAKFVVILKDRTLSREIRKNVVEAINLKTRARMTKVLMRDNPYMEA